MSETRNGKLARLPSAIRDQLNQRLENGEPGNHLVDWLNSLPEVRAVLAAEFGGVPVSGQNLSRWKQGGYRDWLARRETRAVAGEMAAEASVAAAEGKAPLSETLAQWVAAHYAVATQRIAGADGEESWRLLREISADVGQMRRRDQASVRLELTRERQANPLYRSRRLPGIASGLDALLECTQHNPQAQAALEQLIFMARAKTEPSHA